MNQYLKNLNKIEFVVTYACTGRCKHCSEGDHTSCGERIDPQIAANVVRKIAAEYDIKTVNDMPEFRTSLTAEGLGVYDDMHPMYTVFNKENKNFSGIWSYFSEDYDTFLQNYEEDSAKYSTSTRYAPKEGTPVNSFNISMVPWLEFTGFNINVYDEGKFLLPIFTMGKYFEHDGKRMLPLAIQVHHAVCDGYHVGIFVEKLQKYIDEF